MRSSSRSRLCLVVSFLFLFFLSIIDYICIMGNSAVHPPTSPPFPPFSLFREDMPFICAVLFNIFIPPLFPFRRPPSPV